MDWRIAVARKALLEHLPFAAALRRAKRRGVGYRPDRSNLETTLENYARIHGAAAAHGRPVRGARVLEVGSGWFPLIPILLCADGAREVIMTDANRHFDAVTFEAAIGFLRETMPGRAEVLRVRRFEDLPLRYLAPFDPAQVPEASVDLIVSRTVLEHIPVAALSELMAGLRPRLAPGGLAIHLVDHSDHLQHIDRSISPINFLGWSEAKHRLVNALTGEGENRLRHHDYPPLFRRTGYRVIAEESEIHEPTRQWLPRTRLVPPWSGMSPEQLAVLVSLYVLQDAAGPAAPAQNR